MDIFLWALFVSLVIMLFTCVTIMIFIAYGFYIEFKQYREDRRRFDNLVKSDYVTTEERLKDERVK